MSSTITVILVHPSIPQNTGNIIRMCAKTGTDLGLVEPCAFGWEDARLRRAHVNVNGPNHGKAFRNVIPSSHGDFQ